MYLHSARIQFGKYGFRFNEQFQSNTANIWSIGWEEQTSTDYSWNGMKRGDTGTYVFQYTISGRGAIEIEGKPYSLHPGQAFIVEIPSQHHYFLPEDSERWEFIYISLKGKEASSCWDFLMNHSGSIVRFSIQDKIIQLLISIYFETVEKRITDTYTASARAYEFVMECYRFAKNIEKRDRTLPKNISKATYFIQNHYHEPITLDDIALHIDLSRYYFIKQFQKYMNLTPLQYLTKIRIEKAVELLNRTDFSIEEIAKRTGYANANYFNKVFRKTVGTSAGQFRKGKDIIPVDHLILE